MDDYAKLSASDGTGEAILANIQADRAISSTTLDVDNVDNWPQEFIFATGTLLPNNYIDPSTMTVMYGHLDTGNIIIDGYADGYTDAGNTEGQIAIIKPTTEWVNQMITLAKVSHNDDGTLKDGVVTTAKIADSDVTSEKLQATVACRAYRSTPFTITGGGGAEKLILNSESYDLGSDWDTTNGRFTAPVTGYYQVNANVRANNVNDGGIFIVAIYVNGTLYSECVNNSSTGLTTLSSMVSDTVYAQSGQYIEMYVDCSTTESLDVSSTANNYMSIHLVGAA